MGVPASFDALSSEIGFTPPSLRGLDSMDAIRPLSEGGGSRAAYRPEPLRRCRWGSLT